MNVAVVVNEPSSAFCEGKIVSGQIGLVAGPSTESTSYMMLEISIAIPLADELDVL
jgi:hypothetical protein